MCRLPLGWAFGPFWHLLKSAQSIKKTPIQTLYISKLPNTTVNDINHNVNNCEHIVHLTKTTINISKYNMNHMVALLLAHIFSQYYSQVNYIVTIDVSAINNFNLNSQLNMKVSLLHLSQMIDWLIMIFLFNSEMFVHNLLRPSETLVGYLPKCLLFTNIKKGMNVT